MANRSDARREIWGSLAIAVTSVVLFIAAMGSMTLIGQTAGEKARAAINRTDLAIIPDSSGAAPVFQREVPILCYHYIRGNVSPLRVLKVLGYVILSLPVLDDLEVWTQSDASFERQMAYLHDNGFNVVTLEDVVAWREGEKDLPVNPVAITFDDGDRSVYDYAFPILKSYGYPATMFLVTGKVGQDWSGIEGLNWGELREMSDSGIFTIESHTNDMHYKVKDDDVVRPVLIAASQGDYRLNGMDWRESLESDFATSRKAIYRNIGREPLFIAWPYGASNEAVMELALDAGFTHAFAMSSNTNYRTRGLLDPPWQAVELDRFAITARTSMRGFRAIVDATKGQTL